MPELFNVNGEVKRVFTHRQTCPVPNMVDEVNRLNNRVVQPHEHKWMQTTIRLPGNSAAKVSKCVYTKCGIRVMVMLEPVEQRVWESVGETGTTIADYAKRK